jgi:hypothetical protein
MADDGLDSVRKEFLEILRPFLRADDPDFLTNVSNAFNVALKASDYDTCMAVYRMVAESSDKLDNKSGTFRYMTRRLADCLAPTQTRSTSMPTEPESDDELPISEPIGPPTDNFAPEDSRPTPLN